jgi:hypothetical protein
MFCFIETVASHTTQVLVSHWSGQIVYVLVCLKLSPDMLWWIDPERNVFWVKSVTEWAENYMTVNDNRETQGKRGKVVPVLLLSTTPCRRIGEWSYSSTHSLTSQLDGGEWSASRPGRFISRERAPGINWIGGWMGPRAVLDMVVKRKIPSPPPGIEP